MVSNFFSLNGFYRNFAKNASTTNKNICKRASAKLPASARVDIDTMLSRPLSYFFMLTRHHHRHHHAHGALAAV
jgi:hypothetical protein